MSVEKNEEWRDLLLEIASSSCRISFRKIFNHFYPLIINQSLKSGLTSEISAELAQETLIRIWEHAKSFDPSKGDATQWIYIIARNLKYDYLRKHRNDPLKASSNDIYSDDLFFISTHSQDALFDLNQLKIQMQKISNDQQEIIYKIYFKGMTQQEIALESGIPLGTVKSRLRLAVSAIKKLMGEK